MFVAVGSATRAAIAELLVARIPRGRGRPVRSLLSAARRVPALSVFLVAALWPGAGAAQPTVLPEIQVISTSPLGGGIDRDKVPALVQSITAEDISRSYSQNVTETLFQYLPGVSTSDQQGNSFQTDIRYRGFVASPVPGQPQGLAVYMNGMRINEAFGDTVNFDFIPSNAVARADIQSNNPVFGLNALGGAINFQMKNGFTYHGFEGEFLLGSYGRISTGLQYGIQKGDVAAYIAVQGLNETGWRQHSPSQLARVYADVGWRHDGNEVHVIFGAASNFFGVVAAVPIELAQRDWAYDLYLAADYAEPEHLRQRQRQIHGDRELDAAGQFLRPQLQAGAPRRQRRRRGALQQCVVVPQQAMPGRRRLPAAEPDDARVPQSVRGSRSEQQPDPVPARRRQHLRASALRLARPNQHRRRSRSAPPRRRPTTRSCSGTATVSSSAAASTTAGPTSPRRARSASSTPTCRSPSIPPSRATARSSIRWAMSGSSRSI